MAIFRNRRTTPRRVTLASILSGSIAFGLTVTALADQPGHGEPGAAAAAQIARNPATDPKAPPHGRTPHWSYQGDTGPDAWGRMSAAFRACEVGRMQSPIDIDGRGAGGASVHPVEFDYRATPLAIVHNGHTVQINYAPGSGIRVNGERYELLQFHFHTPSEHAIKGRRAPMEVHFVHKNDKGALAVIGVMIEGGRNNVALREIWQYMPQRKSAERRIDRVAINARDLLPRGTGYFRYMGSLTTPPCSEGVNWYVMQTPIEADNGQIQRFARAVQENARPLQALNHRIILAPLSKNP